MTDTNELRARVDDIFRSLGLIRRGGIWYGSDGAIVPVAELQKSRYGSSSYINVGVHVPKMSGDRLKHVADAAVSFRAEELLGNESDEDEFSRCLVSDARMDDEHRYRFLDRAMSDEVLPALRAIRTESDLSAIIRTNDLWNSHAPVETEKYLNLA